MTVLFCLLEFDLWHSTKITKVTMLTKILKMGVVCSSEVLVSAYKSSRCYSSADECCYGSLKTSHPMMELFTYSNYRTAVGLFLGVLGEYVS